jgi:hypothetical protein
MIADVDIPEIPNKLLVYSVIRPDSLIKVHVGHDINVINTEYPESIENANVTITTSNNRTFVATNTNGIYSFDRNILVAPLVRYRLDVDVNGFEKVHAISEIPYEVPIESAEISWERIKINVFGSWYNHYIANLTFTDPISSNNYYRVLVLIKATGLDYDIVYEFDESTGQNIPVDTLWDETKEIVTYEPVDFDYKTDVVLDPKSNWETYNHMTFNDDLINGENYTLQVPIDSYYLTEYIKNYHNDQMDTIVNFEAIFVLCSINQSLYDYYTTASLQHVNAKDIFSEPVQIMSNIENGFGVFGAENLSTYAIELHKYD